MTSSRGLRRRDARRAAIGCGLGSVVLVVVGALLLLGLVAVLVYVVPRLFDAGPVRRSLASSS